MRNLQIMHFFVLFGQVISKTIDSFNLDWHSSIFFHVFGVLLYAVIILIDIDQILFIFTLHKKDEYSCQFDIGNSHIWIIIEIGTFFINMMVIALYLILFNQLEIQWLVNKLSVQERFKYVRMVHLLC